MKKVKQKQKQKKQLRALVMSPNEHGTWHPPQDLCRTFLLSLRALPSVKHVPPPHALQLIAPSFYSFIFLLDSSLTSLP